MKNYVLLPVCMLSAIAASAQYCSIQKGQKLLSSTYKCNFLGADNKQ